MAKFLTVTRTIQITDGGVTVVDAQQEYQSEVMEFLRSTARIENGGDITFCVRGTDVAAITDPFVLPLDSIRGYSIESDQKLEVKEDDAAAAVQAGPGAFGPDSCALSTLELANASGLPANIKFIIWGDR